MTALLRSVDTKLRGRLSEKRREGLTSPRMKRISSPRKFRYPPQKTFSTVSVIFCCATFLRARSVYPRKPPRRLAAIAPFQANNRHVYWLSPNCYWQNYRSNLRMLKAPQIRFCKASDGVRIAYATTGRGPAMIEVSTWLNHLEFDWQSPVWRPRLVEMAKNYTMTRYDGRGCGLSDRTVEDLSFDANLRDLEAVADAAGYKRFVLLGCCQGSGLAIAYAARHPERVSNLVLYGAFARGRLKRNPSAQDLEEASMMLKLVELGWGRENPAFRQVYTTLFIPESTPEQFSWFTDLQRMSTSAENAVGLIKGFELDGCQ